MHPAAIEAMVDALGRTGNPSSLHAPGRAARRLVEESRELVAERLGARASDVLLTGGGTEADNLAVQGIYRARVGADPRRRRVLVSAVEHHAVLDPAESLTRQGAQVVRLPVDGTGRLDLAALATELAAHGDEVALVSVMWANNEIGTVQPVGEVVALAAEHGVPVHCDAVQAVGHLPVDFAASGLAAMTVTGHKLGGPVGAGALLTRRGLDLVPLMHGGGQERGIRPGTLDAPAVRAFAVALDLAVRAEPVESVRLAGLRDAAVQGLRRAVPDVVLRGPRPGPLRLPGNVHVTVPGCDGESLLFLLDSRGIACSTGSACQAGVARPSHVLLACGVAPEQARGAVRFSLGRTTTAQDVDTLLAVLPGVVDRARAAGRASSAPVR
ncbi:MAG TPA: cysteine desulfurase family protein [Actinotalea sp.]|nr:cysteine desulfurase family protein [Actinotalea sp.]